ncbi:MAG: hypothetical protein ACYC1M_12110 [Armatimonadota bacterium]
MSLLTDMEKQTAAADVRELLISSGQEAQLFRAGSEERLYGSDDAAFTEIGRFKLEFALTSREDMVNKIDATACVLPEQDICEQDRIQVGNQTYRVQSVTPEQLFGVTTHKTLRLVEIHGD